MARDEVIARRYARGLAEYAAAGKVADSVRNDLKLAADLLDPHAGDAYSPDLARFLASPVPETDRKIAVMDAVLAGMNVGEGVRDFFAVLARHGRIGMLPRISRCFAELSGELTGEYVAVVHTARRLTEDQEKRLSEALSAALGASIRLHQLVEPGLLAGARVTVGDKTFDGTVLGRLDSLRHRLRRSGALDLERLQVEETSS